MTFTFRNTTIATVVATMLSSMSGCGIYQTNRDQEAITADAKASVETAQRSRPVVQVHEGSWLMGEKVRASKVQPEIFDNPVVFKDKSVFTLTDIATWIAQNMGVRAEVDASAQSMATPLVSGAIVPPVRPAGPFPTDGATPALSSALPSFSGATPTPFMPMRPSAPQGPFSYTGKFKGFLDVIDARYGVWSRYQDGVVVFFKTETRTFTIPTLADDSSMSGTITTGDSTSSGSSSGGSGGQTTGGSVSSGQASNSGSSSGDGGQTMKLQLQSTPWGTLRETAAAIAGSSAQVIADKNLGVLTVTGSPPQCERVEQWVKSLNAMFGKQVAIDVHVYQVQLTREDNYGLDLSLAYKSGSGHTGATFAGASPPTVTSSSTPMTFGANIVGGSLDGTKAAIQALSTLGNVSQVVSRSGVTQNGKLLALQAAKSQGYVASTSTTLAASVGSSTSIQTGTLVPGFTSSFLPKVVDGRILIDFDMTLSDLLRLDTFVSGTGSSQSSVQLPLEQITRFQQSISLKPGETLVLTGMRQQSASTTNNGIGSPWMPLLGGGVDAQKGDTIISVVISARLL